MGLLLNKKRKKGTLIQIRTFVLSNYISSYPIHHIHLFESTSYYLYLAFSTRPGWIHLSGLYKGRSPHFCLPESLLFFTAVCYFLQICLILTREIKKKKVTGLDREMDIVNRAT